MTSNVTRVPPRRFPVHYKGLHGFVEYKPSDKKWHWTFKAQMTIKNAGEEESKDKAITALKAYIDVAATSKHITSLD